MATSDSDDLDRCGDEYFDFLCSVCRSNNKNTEAEKFCSECRDYYCSTCVKLHERFPALKAHKILDKVQFKAFPAVPTEKCKQHDLEPVDMFCESHDVVGCSACMMVDHRNCKDKFYVPHYIQNNMKSDCDPKDISRRLDTTTHSLQDLQKNINEDLQKITENKDVTLQQIKDSRQNINQILDVLEENTVQEVERRFQPLLHDVNQKMKDLLALAIELKCVEDSLKSAGGNKSQLFVNIKRANEVNSQIVAKFEDISTIDRPQLCFSINPRLLMSELQSMGTIDEIRTDQYHVLALRDALSPVALHSVSREDTNKENTEHQVGTQISSETSDNKYRVYFETDETKCKNDVIEERSNQPQLPKIIGSKTQAVKVSTDEKVCHIIGACLLEDGTVILSDNNNNKLKRLYSLNYSVRDYVSVPESPCQVCVINKQEVAVACDKSKLIQIVSLESTMQGKTQIDVGFPCCGLAYSSGNFFVSDRFKSVFQLLLGLYYSKSIYIITSEEVQELRKVRLENPLIVDIASLAISKDGTKIYVADTLTGLIILDEDGEIAGQFSDPVLKRAHDVCLFRDGSVLVCGRDSKNILQIGTVGNLIGEVVKSNKEFRSVCCNADQSKLITSYCSYDFIEVFDIDTI